MSQQTIQHLHYEIIFGWDRPLGTYFASVIDLNEEEDDYPLIWLGTTQSEHLDPMSFLDSLEKSLTDAGILDVLRSCTRLK